MKRLTIQSIRGIKDLLPPDTGTWRLVEEEFRRVCDLYNYREIRIPLLEKTSLFSRSIGEETDIVKKEMYTFADAGGEEISLRPEGTAGILRAYIQHALGAREPVSKLFCLGPMFRKERPQKGRYRQFHQADAEVFGAPGPMPEVEQIAMLKDFFTRIGIGNTTFLCNHLGSQESRKEYAKVLHDFFKSFEESLCEDCRERLNRSTLRILDCKQVECRKIISRSPSFEEYRPESSRAEIEKFTRLLGDLSIRVRMEPRLVRGLDYYTGIVFEVVIEGEEEAGGPRALVGGGRYDDLARQLGGEDTPAVGFAIGMERLIEICGARLGTGAGLDIAIAAAGPEAESHLMKLLKDLRAKGFKCDFDPRMGSLKSQMKRADRLSASLVMILGENEIKAGTVTVREMADGRQTEIGMENLEKFLAEKLRGRGSVER